MDCHTPYKATLKREPFMFFEMRVTAELLHKGLAEEDIIETVVRENLFQSPTEKTLKMRCRACLRRLAHLDQEMIAWIVARPMDAARQVCLYAFMKESRLVCEFMVTVIGEKYRTLDYSYSRSDITKYMNRIQEQSETVAKWSECTIKGNASAIGGLLKEVGYIDTPRSRKLNEIVIDYKLKDKLIEKGEEEILSAFNCFI